MDKQEKIDSELILRRMILSSNAVGLLSSNTYGKTSCFFKDIINYDASQSESNI